MKDHSLAHTITRHVLAWLLASLTFLASNGTRQARADVITFAQFTQQMVSDQGFGYANNATNATFSSLAGGIPILLTITQGFAPGLDRVEPARLILSSSTTAPAIPPVPPDQFTQERFTGPTNELQIILATPINGKSNFLTATFSDALFSGRLNSTAASLRASGNGGDGLPVSFTSDFIDFTDATEFGLSLSFSSLLSSDGSGDLQMGENGFLKSFTASGTGTFDTSLAAPIAEPYSLVLAAIALLGLLPLAWKGR